jgi:hypothetical protein
MSPRAEFHAAASFWKFVKNLVTGWTIRSISVFATIHIHLGPPYLPFFVLLFVVIVHCHFRKYSTIAMMTPDIAVEVAAGVHFSTGPTAG